MTIKYIALEATIEFPFSVNDPSTGGVADADTAPPFDVRLQGAAASAAPVYSGTASLLSHVNFPAGQYAAVVPATTGNGFATDSFYSVYASAAVTTTTGAVIGEFRTTALMDNTAVEAAVDAALIAYNSAAGVVSNTNLNARTIVAANIPTTTTISDLSDTVTNGHAAITADILVTAQVLTRSDAANATDNLTKINEINTDNGSGAGTFDPTTDLLTGIGFTFTKANELDVNTKSINGATVVGDGNTTPWDGA